MHTSSSILPQNAPSGVYHLEEKSEWVKPISQKIAAFYAYGFLYKWLRSFRHPSILVVSDQPVDTAPWKKRFKTAAVHQMTLQQALDATSGHSNPVDMLIVFQQNAPSEKVLQFSPLLNRSGAFVWITQNRYEEWEQIQTHFERHEISQTFALGFHPQGAVAWWPWSHPLGIALGKLVEIVVTFFPGRNQAARRFGKFWLIRGIKCENDTQLT